MASTKHLGKLGIEVLYDDRAKKVASPGVKFKDADLRGIPIRLTVSRRNLESNGIEMKLRGSERRLLSLISMTRYWPFRKPSRCLYDEIQEMVDAVPNWEKEKHLWEVIEFW